MENCKGFWTKATLYGLALGQLLSLLITSTGFSSSELAKKGINAPTSQSFVNYVLLALIYGSIMLYRRQALKSKWYYYILLGIVDVEANFLVVKAYQYTSITSVMLLDCWTIPCVLFLTWFFLKTKYRVKKLIGVVICIAGLVTVIFSDVHAADRSSGANPIKGDILVLAGATLYGVSNVSETLPFVGYSLAMFLFYSGVPILLKISGSTMLNLSLLTSDMWAVLIRIFAYHEKVDWLYFIAFGAVTVGLIVYSGGEGSRPEAADMEAGLRLPDHKDKTESSISKQEDASSSNMDEQISKAK
ncbi:uncharacterized protein LOC127264530 isoform X2 [Andrographis paniculata]|uniref:uncharacterized protein LOC127264530 isoform X2 n=1 Tax=Andrographis paniculata TaxID=175694 RepID=UPI0021E94F82|nr:uncharacterized protein LOC127264530 isoform X2 [Andrographis paniculata]